MHDDSTRSRVNRFLREFPCGSSTFTDTALTVLANDRRRYVLYYLWNRTDAVVDVTELHEFCSSGLGLDETSREHLHVELLHHHLPMLDDAEVLTYDPRTGTVRYSKDNSLERILEKTSRLDGVELYSV